MGLCPHSTAARPLSCDVDVHMFLTPVQHRGDALLQQQPWSQSQHFPHAAVDTLQFGTAGESVHSCRLLHILRAVGVQGVTRPTTTGRHQHATL